VLDALRRGVLGAVAEHAGLGERRGPRRGDAELLGQPDRRGRRRVLAGRGVPAARVGPAQREARLDGRALLHQHAARGVVEHHGERAVQAAGRGVRRADRAGAKSLACRVH
jgi:hypothetical protein